MANKHICDRCGKEIPQEFTDNLYFVEARSTILNDYELCEDCKKQFYEWLENKEKQECKCSNNKNVLELLDQLESAEKRNCEQSERIEQLLKENRLLVNGAVQRLIEKCHFKIEFNFDE